MTDLPETELTLSPNFKTARRFFYWLNPADGVDRFQPNARADEVPHQRSSHVFVVQDDCIVSGQPRNYPALSDRLIGTFDDCATRLAEANIRARVGVFVELDTAQMLVAHYAGTPEHGQGGRAHGWEAAPVEPSIRISTGTDQETWLWLFDGELSSADRAAIGAVLQRHGASLTSGSSALCRIPGFYSRQGEPFYCMAYGSRESGYMEAKRHFAESLRGAFLGWPEAAPVDAPPKAAIGKQRAEAEAEDKRRVAELKHRGMSTEQATETAILEREMQSRLDRMGVR